MLRGFEMIETSPEINELAGAMAAAQAIIEGAVKDSSNPHFKSKYADLANVWAAWQKAGPSNGLAVMQFPGDCADNRMAMTTLITHKSGQWVKSSLSIPLAKVDAQGYGSATTYARRYALAAAVGIAPEDDDGNAASSPNGVANNAPKQSAIDDAQWAEIMQLMQATNADTGAFCTAYKIRSVRDLPAASFERARKQLETKLAKMVEAEKESVQ